MELAHEVEAATIGCGRFGMFCSRVLAFAAGGCGTRKPPTAMNGGAPPVAPCQFGAAALPVPGQLWHELQSTEPETLVKVL